MRPHMPPPGPSALKPCGGPPPHPGGGAVRTTEYLRLRSVFFLCPCARNYKLGPTVTERQLHACCTVALLRFRLRAYVYRMDTYKEREKESKRGRYVPLSNHVTREHTRNREEGPWLYWKDTASATI